MPDTMERSIDIATAQRIIAEHGGRVVYPETPQERMDGKWQDFLRLAKDLEYMLANGTTLPPRPRATVMPGCCEMVRRVLEKLQATTPVEIEEPEQPYVADF